MRVVLLGVIFINNVMERTFRMSLAVLLIRLSVQIQDSGLLTAMLGVLLGLVDWWVHLVTGRRMRVLVQEIALNIPIKPVVAVRQIIVPLLDLTAPEIFLRLPPPPRRLPQGVQQLGLGHKRPVQAGVLQINRELQVVVLIAACVLIRELQQPQLQPQPRQRAVVGEEQDLHAQIVLVLLGQRVKLLVRAKPFV